MKILNLTSCTFLTVVVLAGQIGFAVASTNPIPGVDVIVKLNGVPIRVGDCLAQGWAVVKVGGKWVCKQPTKK